MIFKAASDATLKVLCLDVSRDYFYAKSMRPTYMKVPGEDSRSRDSSACGHLLMTMFGMRDAAFNWAQEHTAAFSALG